MTLSEAKAIMIKIQKEPGSIKTEDVIMALHIVSALRKPE